MWHGLLLDSNAVRATDPVGPSRYSWLKRRSWGAEAHFRGFGIGSNISHSGFAAPAEVRWLSTCVVSTRTLLLRLAACRCVASGATNFAFSGWSAMFSFSSGSFFSSYNSYTTFFDFRPLHSTNR